MLPLTAFLLDCPWNRGPAPPGLSRARSGGDSMPEVIYCQAKRHETAAEGAAQGAKILSGREDRRSLATSASAQ